MWKVQGGGGDKGQDRRDPIHSRFRSHRSILDTQLYKVTKRMRPLSLNCGIIVCCSIDVDASYCEASSGLCWPNGSEGDIERVILDEGRVRYWWFLSAIEWNHCIQALHGSGVMGAEGWRYALRGIGVGG